MRRDIVAARELGVDGIVAGALRRDGTVDPVATAALRAAAHPRPFTFHRAFDFTRDAAEALAALVGLGVERVLTAGRAATAVAGIPALAALVRQAAGRIVVLAGGGITAETAGRIVRETGVREIHVRAAAPVESGMVYRPAGVTLRRPMPEEWTREAVAVELVRAVVGAIA
jgi:copper homeostasis protein